MDARFLEYYNRELTYLRELGAEFARSNPKAASRLGMHGMEVADPYVERLLEGFCFLTARVQLKMDAEFPRFSERLLDVVFPNHLAPIPSMAIAKLHVDPRESRLMQGYVVPAGASLYRRLGDAGATCEFRTAHALTLWPISLDEVRTTGVPPDLPAMGQGVRASARGAVRIVIGSQTHVPLHQLPLDRLDLYLCGPDAQAVRLLELLAMHALAVACRDPDSGECVDWLEPQAIAHEGFAAAQAMLPTDARSFEGHRLLHEYFAFPARFHFISIGGLRKALSRTRSHRLELIVLLDQADGALERTIDASHLALHCTPVVNLFPRVTDRIPVTSHSAEYRLVADRTRPLDYEIHSVRRVNGHRLGDEASASTVFLPFFASNGADHDGEAYFSLRREPRLVGAHSMRHGARTGYTGTDTYVALVDRRHAPFDERIELLSAEGLCTNCDLPLLVSSGTRSDLIAKLSLPIDGIEIVRGPTRPRPPLARDQAIWRAIDQLGIGYQPTAGVDDETGARDLREWLSLYADPVDSSMIRQVAGIRRLACSPIVERLPEAGPIAFGRGVLVDMTVDEQAFSGESPYLLGAVLEQFFARYASINSFTRLALHSLQRGALATWRGRIGRRPTL
ncbi:type VI secretion system baseplate subunit TssF [Trinickia sp. Y13]|uniref:type VI secretion system baseplate subunit TssF n=1 Tax=Trinickia sp. Y13 TaxID=2917807 RepID=UPI00240703E2|nr:type VI secretion system baseplate subunit TssF [Trinickia sp. Y13]MDG0023210.1 type VI secretion system baseplate subunit TssF [Trinickia sp. Y13]